MRVGVAAVSQMNATRLRSKEVENQPWLPWHEGLKIMTPVSNEADGNIQSANAFQVPVEADKVIWLQIRHCNYCNCCNWSRPRGRWQVDKLF